jgi:flavin reductase (DIM6/NTAB) family NADH-FMN oxidoreductase RutF
VEHEIEPREFRNAAGQFMTGVTIVTTLDADGAPSGLTANSFASVSLDPPLVQFSLGRNSTNIDAFEAGSGFVVHVLAAEQQDLSMRFASKGIDRFEGTDWAPGHGGLPVLSGSLAAFECSPWATYDGGDHLIYIGRVERLTIGNETSPALGYFRGRYYTSPE